MPRVGTNTALLPWRCQAPSIEGASVGIGEVALSGSLKSTRISAAPLTPFVPSAGVIESTCSGAGAAGRWLLVRPSPAALAGLDFCTYRYVPATATSAITAAAIPITGPSLRRRAGPLPGTAAAGAAAAVPAAGWLIGAGLTGAALAGAGLAGAGLAGAGLAGAGLAGAGLAGAGLGPAAAGLGGVGSELAGAGAGPAAAGLGGVGSDLLVKVGHGPLSGSADRAARAALPVLPAAAEFLAITGGAEAGTAG